MMQARTFEGDGHKAALVFQLIPVGSRQGFRFHEGGGVRD